MDGWMDGWSMHGKQDAPAGQGRAPARRLGGPGAAPGTTGTGRRPSAWRLACLVYLSVCCEQGELGGGGGVPIDRDWGHKRRVVNRFLTLKLANDDAVISADWLAHFRNGQGVRPLCERGGNQDGGGGGDRRDVRLSRPHFRACGPDGVVAARWGRACRRLQPTRKRGGHNGHSTVRLAEQWR